MGFEITTDSSGCITITKYILEPDDSSTVILPRGTVRIGEEAFKDCVGIARIILPDNVGYQGLDIDKNAFANCIDLEMVVFPGDVMLLEKNIFSNCRKLKHIYCDTPYFLDKTVLKDTAWLKEYRGDFVILGDILLEYRGTDSQVTVPDRVRVIAEGAFENSDQICSVILPYGVMEIGHKAFAGCSCLSNVSMPNTLTYIGNAAFYNCTSLERITIPENVNYIGDDAFDGCVNLIEIEALTDKVDSLPDLIRDANQRMQTQLEEFEQKMGKASDLDFNFDEELDEEFEESYDDEIDDDV